MNSFSKNRKDEEEVRESKICKDLSEDRYTDCDCQHYDEYNDPIFYDENGNRRRPTLKEGFDAYRKDIRDASAPFKTDKNLQKGCLGYGLLALFIIIMIIID